MRNMYIGWARIAVAMAALSSIQALASAPVVVSSEETWKKFAAWNGVLDMSGATASFLTMSTKNWFTTFDFDGDGFSVSFSHPRETHNVSYVHSGRLSDVTVFDTDSGGHELALHLKSDKYGATAYSFSVDYVAATYDELGSRVDGGRDGLMYLAAAVPEPDEYAMLIPGLALVGAAARRRYRKRN